MGQQKLFEVIKSITGCDLLESGLLEIEQAVCDDNAIWFGKPWRNEQTENSILLSLEFLMVCKWHDLRTAKLCGDGSDFKRCLEALKMQHSDWNYLRRVFGRISA